MIVENKGQVEDIFLETQPVAGPVADVASTPGVMQESPAQTAAVARKPGKKAVAAAVVLLVVAVLPIGAYFSIPRFADWTKNSARSMRSKAVVIYEQVIGKAGKDAPANCPDDQMTCPDGSVVRRIGSDCSFPGCPDAELESGPEEASPPVQTSRIVTDKDLSFYRDMKRIADISRVRAELKDRFERYGSYPDKYLSLPADPAANGNDYIYRSLSRSGYALIYEFEQEQGTITKGPAISTAESEAPAVDSDSDGLYDLEEAMYGTDPQEKDSDRDGYGDLDELKAGFDPRGRGKQQQAGTR